MILCEDIWIEIFCIYFDTTTKNIFKRFKKLTLVCKYFNTILNDKHLLPFLCLRKQKKLCLLESLRRDRLDIAKYLLEREECTQDDHLISLHWACKYGKLEAIKLVYYAFSFRELNLLFITRAAKYGYLDIVKWLCEFHLEDERLKYHMSLALDIAAANGHLDVVKWLYYHPINDLEMHIYAVETAFAHNHFHIVDWINENVEHTGHNTNKRKCLVM